MTISMPTHMSSMYITRLIVAGIGIGYALTHGVFTPESVVNGTSTDANPEDSATTGVLSALASAS